MTPIRRTLLALSLVEERAQALGYDASLSALPGSGLRYAAETWFSQMRAAIECAMRNTSHIA